MNYICVNNFIITQNYLNFLFYIFLFLLRALPLNAQNHAIVFPGANRPSSSSLSLYDQLGLNDVATRNLVGTQGGRCILSSGGGSGTCVSLNECAELRPLYTPGRRLTAANRRILRSRICRVFGNLRIFFCCGRNRAGPRPPFNGEISLPTTPRTPDTRGANLIPDLTVCGISTGGRITNGKEIKPHSHPWMVSLGALENGRYVHSCGGTLITKRHVVTAAHCYDPRAKKITHAALGEHSLTTEEPDPVKIIKVAGRKSPGYNARSQENDIELLRLEEDVSFTANIRPICWPRKFVNHDFSGRAMTIIGWGDTFFRSNEGSDKLLGATIPVIPKADCLKDYSRQRGIVIDKRQICAGVGGEDACQGDSGGPLIYKEASGRHYLIGIVSFGVECAREDFPGVYTDIREFLDWCEENF